MWVARARRAQVWMVAVLLCGAEQDPKAGNDSGAECRKINWYFTVKYAGARCGETQLESPSDTSVEARSGRGCWLQRCRATGCWDCRWTLEVEQETIRFPREDTKYSNKRFFTERLQEPYTTSIWHNHLAAGSAKTRIFKQALSLGWTRFCLSVLVSLKRTGILKSSSDDPVR